MPFDPAGRGRLAGLVFMAIASLHFATAVVGGPARNWHGQTSDYYPLLADAFRAGQTSLLVKPVPELLALPDPYDPQANGQYRLHDASLYHGKYYLYFGPTPALVLFLPFRVLTGSHLPTRVGVGLFCALGFGFSCLLLFRLAKGEKWDLPGWLGSAAALSLGAAPGVAFLLIRPSFYEVAISAGYCFAMAGFLLAAQALAEDTPRIARLAGAGLCFGLAAGCRPDLALPAAVMAALVLFRCRARKAQALAFAAPVAVCGALLLAYNYARFHDPLEFGIRYILLANRGDLNEHFGHTLGNLLPSIFALIASPAKLVPLAPGMGLLWGAPVAVFGLCMPLVLRYRRNSERFTIYGIYVSAVGVLILLGLMGFVLGRYTVDFAPEFLVLAWCALAALWQAAQRWSRAWQALFQIVVVGAAVYSAILDFSICVTRIPG